MPATAPPSACLWHFHFCDDQQWSVMSPYCIAESRENAISSTDVWNFLVEHGTPPHQTHTHRENTQTPSTYFSCSRKRAGLSVCTMKALWGLNALLAPGNHGCIQIKMTDKDIKAQWHFTDLWYCSRLLCIQGFKLKAVGNIALSESLQVDAEHPVTYCASFFFLFFFSVCNTIFSYTAIKRVIRPTSIINGLCHTSTYGFKVNTRDTVWKRKKSHYSVVISV